MLRKLVVGAALAAAGTGLIFGVLPQALASATTTVSEFSLLPGTDPWGTAFDHSGRVWVALPGCDFHPSCDGTPPPGRLALFDPAAKSATLVTLPDGFGQPIFVAVDSDGMVWFTMPVTNALGRYDPTSKSFAQWTVPTKNAGPWGLAIAPHNGKIWFTEHFVNKIGWFNPHSEKFHEIATPAVDSNPYGITVDASNNVWFTENNPAVALIGEYNTDLEVLKEYKIRTTQDDALTPHLITVDPATGNVWWSEGFATAVGVLKVAAAQPGTNKGVTEFSYACDFCGHTSGISIHNGQVWVDDSVQNNLRSISTTGGSFSPATNLTTQNAHPHDGLNVDAQGRVWFDEEFANNLAVATP